MYKVLLADDELLVRTNIKLLIDWKEENLELCGEASNGHEALELIKNQKPHILITDMCMPKMSGLELCEQTKKLYPQISVIILSNFDDFDYVRGTLKLGALDYLLKNSLSKQILSATLSKAKYEVDIYKSKPINVQNSFAPNNITALRKELINKILTGLYSNETEIKMHLQLLELNLGTKNIIPIVMSVDGFDAYVGDKGLVNRNILEFGIINISEELLAETEAGIICSISSGYFAILLSFKNVSSTIKVNNETDSIIKRIGSTLQLFLNISVSFSIGTLCTRIMDIKRNFEAAEAIMKKKFYYGKNCILRGHENIQNHTIDSGLKIELEKELIQQIGLLNRTKISNIIDIIFSEIAETRTSMMGCQMIFNDLLNVMNKYIKSEQLDSTSVYASTVTPIELVTKLETLDLIKDWFETSFFNLLTTLESSNIRTDSIHVKSAVKAIIKSFQYNISQQSIADEIGISSGYLSTIFKDELGIGFNEFLTDYRLNKAKLLIESGNTNFREIVELCGFNDYNYFFKLFKKKVGMTPSKFAQKQRL